MNFGFQTNDFLTISNK